MDVLVPIDGADATRETVEYTLSEYPDASITVLHVSTLNAVYGLGGTYTHESVRESQQQYTDRLFATATETADAHGGSVTRVTTVGSPVREIVAFAEEADTDHIVIGCCGRSGLCRLLFGNVTDGVVRRAAVPVTVVK